MQDFEWVRVKDKAPPTNEPLVYCKPKDGSRKWNVGIAYWTVSEKWNPEAQSLKSPEGFTHWLPLPPVPSEERAESLLNFLLNLVIRVVESQEERFFHPTEECPLCMKELITPDEAELIKRLAADKGFA